MWSLDLIPQNEMTGILRIELKGYGYGYGYDKNPEDRGESKGYGQLEKGKNFTKIQGGSFH